MAGGARLNSGPPPDPNALRRDRKDDKDGWTTLPSGGREGDAPAWPLLEPPGSLDGFADRELDVWTSIWATPQAVAWERNGWSHDVALYVRYLVLADRGDLKAASEARQWSDRLGLNPAAMLRNRWRVAADQLAEQRQRPAKKSSRSRLKVAGSGDS